MSITIKSNPDGVTGAIQVNGVDKVTIGASGITAGSFAPNSIDAAAAALAFSGANQSLASSGYQKLPSGLIIQWGTTASVSTNATLAVTFPITFPNAAFSCLAGGTSNTSNVSVAQQTAMNVVALSATGFTVANDDFAMTARYIAIGY